MPYHQTEAVALRRWRTNEADAIYLLFTESLGKIRANARGVAKTTSRMAATLQPYNRIHVVLYSKHEGQEVLTVTQVSLIRHHPGLQNDLTKLSLTACAAELIDGCTADAEPNPTLWSLLTKLLVYWDEEEATQAQLMAFILRILQSTGFEPYLSSCAACGATERSEWYYNPERGGLVCPTCRKTERMVLSGNAIGLMNRLSAGEKLSSSSYSESDIKHALMLLDEHIGYHVGKRSRALQLLEQLTGTQIRPAPSP